MQKAIALAFNDYAKAYLQLAKPGIIMGNAITAVGGYALGARGHFDLMLFFSALFGLSFIIGSACAFNNYIDRDMDQKMLRTRNRALATGMIATKNAIGFAIFLGVLGTGILAAFVNLMTTGIALFGLFVYVFVYSFMKYRSTHGTLVGSIAGAVPPVVGYCAVTNSFDTGAVLLFIIIAFWQMPHFFAIAIYRMQEYAAASIPVLPIKKGIHRTKVQMLLYVIAFGISCLMLSVYGYTGIAYTITASVIGIGWLCLSIQGFKAGNDALWARKMFIFSLIAITALCAVIPFSVR